MYNKTTDKKCLANRVFFSPYYNLLILCFNKKETSFLTISQGLCSVSYLKIMCNLITISNRHL